MRMSRMSQRVTFWLSMRPQIQAVHESVQEALQAAVDAAVEHCSSVASAYAATIVDASGKEDHASGEPHGSPDARHNDGDADILGLADVFKARTQVGEEVRTAGVA